MINAATRAKYLELRKEAEQEYLKAEPQRKALDEALVRYRQLQGDIDELIDGLEVAECEGCNGMIFEGDMCSSDQENGLLFCEECSPSWEDLAADPGSFYRYDADDEPIYYTKESAEMALAHHLEMGGSTSDKFGLAPY